MSLRQVTREILSQVHEVTGIPVQVVEEPELPTFAAIRLARANAPAHILLYKPSPNEPPDYLIAFQCLSILRIFSLPPERRLDPVNTKRGQEQVRKLLVEPGGPARRYDLDPSQTAHLQAQLLDGLITHLRSVPVGLRVAAQLRRDYPAYQELQRSQVLKELALNREALSPRMKDVAPAKILASTLAINAAFALYWADAYAEPDLALGYRLGGHEQEGQALLKIWKDISPEPLFDRLLIDAWAQRLGLTGWYGWIPYRPPE